MRTARNFWKRLLASMGLERRGSQKRPGNRRGVNFETLEERQMMSVAPLGGEQQVNTYLTHVQELADSGNSVAGFPNGSAVVVWSSDGQDGDGTGIYGQRFDAGGGATGSEFRINSTTNNNQKRPSVAAGGDGSWVAVWQSGGQDGSGQGIYGQRYGANGATVGGEFLVNATTSGDQELASVSYLTGGGFVVVWSGKGTGDNTGIFGRMYGSNGTAQGSEFRINTTTDGGQTQAHVAGTADGGFGVAWESPISGQSTNVLAQRFDASGSKLGGEIAVNTTTNGAQQDSYIAANPQGGFLVTWQSEDQDGSGWGIYGQRYTAAGVPQGSEFLINSTTSGGQKNGVASFDARGGFVVTWNGKGTGDTDGVFAREYDPAGAAVGSEFLVNSTISGTQENPAIAAASSGFVIAWSGSSATDANGVILRRFGSAPSSLGIGTQNVLEDASNRTVDLWSAFTDAENSPQQLNYQIIGNTNSGLVSPSINLATGQLTLSFASNQFGTATLTVQASDPGGLVAQASFAVNAAAVNDSPSATLGGNQTVAEDSGAQAVVHFATNLSAGPANESSQAIDFLVSVDHPELFAVAPAIAADGTLTYTPAANANGVAAVSVRVHDSGGTANGGQDSSDAQTFGISITSVNDAPSFGLGANRLIDEDTAAQSLAGFATGISAGPADESAQTVTFLVSTDHPELFSAAPAISSTGALTYTPATNAFGMAVVTVRAQDDGGAANGGQDTSAAQTFVITITPVNDVPSFALGGDQVSNEDGGVQSIAGFATALSAGPANESDQTLEFFVSADHPELFAAGPAISANGVLSYTALPDAFGVATVTVRLRDSGGTSHGGADTSATQSFTITINPVNDAPSFAVGADVTVPENAGTRTVSGFATAIRVGPDNESAQIPTFLVSTNHPALFATGPTIGPDGTLTFTPVANQTGSAIVTVQLRDNGGTDFGGSFISGPQTFLIAVVNQTPTIGRLEAPSLLISGSALQLRASGISDDGFLQSVAFYRDADNDGVFTLADPLVGTDSSGADGWSASVSTAGLAVGAQRFFAVATDDQSVTSAAASASITLGSVSVLDDLEPGYSEAGSGWSADSSGGIGGEARSHAAGSGLSVAQWSFSGLSPGTYAVQIAWNAAADRAANAPYQISDGTNVLSSVAVDQRSVPSGVSDGTHTWQSLGTVETINGSLIVSLSDLANGILSADAVRIVPVAPLALYWDPDGNAANNVVATGAGLGGSGTWSSEGNVWFDPFTGQNIPWVDGAQAVLRGSAGTLTIAGAASPSVIDALGTFTLQSGTIQTPDAGVSLRIAGTTTIASTVAGAGGLSLSSNGTVILSGDNTFCGGVMFVESSVLQLGSPGALNAAHPNAVTFASGSTGTLRLAGNSVTVSALKTGDVMSGAAIENNGPSAATLTVDVGAGTNSFAGIIRNGTGGLETGLTKAGAGTLILSGPNTYTGLTTAGGGVLRFSAPVATAVSSVWINGGDISIDDGVLLTSRTGNIQFSSNNSIKATNASGGLGFAAVNAAYTVTVDAGVTGTISANITGVGTGNSIKRLGAGQLIVIGQNNLVTDSNANFTAALSVDGSGRFDISGLVKAASSLQSNRSNGTSTVGQLSAGNVLTVSGSGQLIAGRLDVAGGAFGNNSVTISSPGTKTTPSQWIIGNGGQLNVGVSSSGNSYTVSNAAYVYQSNGGGTNGWTVGTNVGANGNALTITGAGSTIDRTGAAGSALVIGAAGNANTLTVSAGGSLLPRRLIVGNGAAVGNGSNNAVLVTGAGSIISVASDSNAVLQIGSGVGSSGNSITVANGGTFNFVGASATRAFSIGSANSANNNFLRVTGAGSSAMITNLDGPLTIGGLNTGTPVDSAASGNHLDIDAGGSLVSTTLQLMGVNSALNLGAGGDMTSSATLGNPSFNLAPMIVNLMATSARVNINNGRLIAGASNTLIGGSGRVQLDGPAFLSTAGFNSAIAVVVQGTGSLTKEGSGTLTLSNTNTYTGATTVIAGTLNVTGSLVSPVTVSGGILAGSGVLAAVTVGNGAFLSPGNGSGAIASLNVGNLALQPGARYEAQLNGDVAGSSFDRLVVTGSVTLGGAQLTLSGTRPPHDGSVLVLLQNDSTDAVSGAFVGLPEGAAVAVNGVVYHITYVYNAEAGVFGGGNDIALIDDSSLGGVGLSVSSSFINENGVVMFGGAFNDPGSTSTHVVSIDWGDGSAPTSLTLPAGTFQFGSLQHQYLDNEAGGADDLISVSVTDELGAVVSATTPVTVFNVAPTATIAVSGLTNGVVGVNVPATVSVTANDLSTIDAASLRYVFSTSSATRDAATYATAGTSASQVFSFTQGGTYVVYARVLDKDGGFTDRQINVPVAFPPQVLYWDTNGAAPGLGGAGTWDLSSANWTTSALGDIATIAWVPGADAVFQGSAGTVSVDATSGIISPRSVQFATTGYIVQGDPLTLLSQGFSATVLGGVTATIDSALNGGTGVGGSIALSKLGSGTLTLSALNGYTGSTAIAAGTLAVNTPGAIPSASAVDVAAGATLSVSAGQTVSTLSGAGHIALSGSAALTVGANNATATFAGVIEGSGRLVKTGAGTFTLSGNNTYTGGTFLGAGTLSINALSDVAGAASALGTSGTITVFNATLQYTGSGTISTARWSTGSVIGATTIDVSQSTATLLIGGSYSTSQSLTKVGAGTLVLGGENQTGFKSASVDAGTLALAMKSTNPNGFNAVGWISDIKPGAILQFRKAADGNFYDGQIRAVPGDTNRQVHMSGGTLDLNGDVVNRIPALDGTGLVTNHAAGTSATLKVFLNFDKTFAGVIEDGAGRVSVQVGAVAHNGFTTSGVAWTLSGINTYMGSTVVTGDGTLKLGADHAISSATSLQIGEATQGWGVLDLNGHDFRVSGLSCGESNTVNNIFLDAITNSSVTPATLAIDTADTTRFDGAFRGNLAVAKYGVGTLAVGGANINTGPTSVYDGKLKVLGSFAVPPEIVAGSGNPQIVGADDPYFSVVSVSLEHGEAAWTSVGAPDLHPAQGNPLILETDALGAAVKALSGSITVGNNSNSPFAFPDDDLNSGAHGNVTIVGASTPHVYSTPFAIGKLGDLAAWVGSGFDLTPASIGVADWNATVIVMEDQFGLSFSDNDFDDDYWVVTVTQVNGAPVAVDDGDVASDPVPAAHWSFDENTGHTATDTMAGLQAGSVNFTSGGALSSTSALQMSSTPPTTDPVDLRGTGDFSISLWAKWTTAGDTVLLSQDDGLGNHWEFSYASGHLQLTVQAAGLDQSMPVDHAWTPPDSNWHHLTITRADNVWKLFVDGSATTTRQILVFPDLGAVPLTIGSTTAAAGSIDDVQLFRLALDSTQVGDLYSGAYSASALATNEETPLTIDVSDLLSNDSDIDSDPLILASYTAPQHGALTFSGSSSQFTYTPAADYFGPDSFTYTIADGKGAVSTATVFLSVAKVNDAPVAKNDFWSTDRNTAVTIAAADLLKNDTDPDGDALTITAKTDGAYGTVALSGGNAVYTPSSSTYTGSDEFTYTVSDGTLTATATVSIHIAADGQWATSATASSSWDSSPYDWLPLQALGTPNTHQYGDIGTAWAPLGEDPSDDAVPPPGTETITFGFATPASATGLLVYETYGSGFVQQIEAYNGSTWSTVWAGTDSLADDIKVLDAIWTTTVSNVSEVRVTISLGAHKDAWEEIDAVKLKTATAGSAGSAPSVSDASATTTEDSSYTYTVGVAATDVITLVQPEHGFAEIDFNGSPADTSDDKIVYTPNADFHGTDTFSYTVTDIWGRTDTATLTVTVTSVNDAPVLSEPDRYVVTDKNTASPSIDVLLGASDVDGDTPSISKINSSTITSMSSVTLASGATVSLVSGKLVYTPASNFTGFDSFTYTVGDGGGGLATGNVFATVYHTGQWAQSVVADSQYGSNDWSATQAAGVPDTFTFGDSPTAWAPLDADGSSQTLTATFASAATATGVLIREVNGTGFITQIELLSSTGSCLSTVTVTDTAPAGHLADLTVALSSPVANVKAVRITVDRNQATDAWEEIDAVRLLTDSVTSSVLATNATPVSVPIYETAETNRQLIIDALAQASDSDGDALTLSVGLASNGTAAVNNNGTAGDPSDDYITYSSTYAGADQFTYTVTDALGAFVQNTVHLRVAHGVYATSVVGKSGESAAAPESGSAVSALGKTSSYPGGWTPDDTGTETLTVAFVEPAVATSVLIREGGAEGFVTEVDVLLDGDTTYTLLWSGTDSTDPTVDPYLSLTNSLGSTPISQVRILVNGAKNGSIDAVKLITATDPASAMGAPSAPSAASVSVTTSEDVPVNIPRGNSDPWALTFTNPAHGSVVYDIASTPDDLSDDYLRYRPDSNFTGTDTFTYTVTDAFGRGDTDTVTVSVSSVNDAPVTVDDWAATPYQTAVDIDVLANDSDVDTSSGSWTLAAPVNGAHGTASVVSGKIHYTPASGFAGHDSFYYTLSDGASTTYGYVTVLVAPNSDFATSVVAASSGNDTASQALGARDDLAADGSHAWTPTGGGNREFLTVGFSTQYATGLSIDQSGAAGLIRQVDLINGSGVTTTIWAGTDSSSGSGLGDFVLRFASSQIASVRIFVDASAGAPQIDAVQLLTGGSYSSTSQSSWSYGIAQSVNATYDSSGKVLTLDTYRQGKVAQLVANTYTGDVLTESETSTVTGFDISGPILQTVTKTFDATSGLVLTEAHGSSTTTYGYTDGKMTSLVDPLDNTTSWSWSGTDSVTETHTALINGSSGTAQTITNYDARGRVKKITYSNDNQSRTFEYNTDDTIASEKWYANTAATGSPAETKTYTYQNGLLTSASDSVTGEYTYVYNHNGQPILVTLPVTVNVGGSPVPMTLAYGYDEYGHRNLIVSNNGDVEGSIYSLDGKLLRRIAADAGDAHVLRIDQQFDASGQLVRQSRYSDRAGTTLVATTTYTYEPYTGLVTSIVTVDGSSDPISSYQYTYNLAGEPTSKTETQNALSGTPVVTSYTNDDQGQLTQEDPDNAATTDYNWDANGNNSDATIGGYNQMTDDDTWSYLYDAKGNLTRKTLDGTSGEYWEYTYSIGNQLTHVEHSSNGTDIDMAEDNSYDVFGNLLKQVVDNDGDGPNAATTVYRAIDGENNLKPTPIGLENYDVFAEINSSRSLITRYVRGDRVDELLGHINTAAAPHAGAFWTITDSLGSVRDTVDNSGAVADSVAYTAFGTVITDVDSSYRSKFGFTGRDYDAASKLQYNRARWYDAESKQFLGQDPRGFAAGDSNLKRYVTNAPTNHNDPTGLQQSEERLLFDRFPTGLPTDLREGQRAEWITYLKTGDIQQVGGIPEKAQWSTAYPADPAIEKLRQKEAEELRQKVNIKRLQNGPITDIIPFAAADNQGPGVFFVTTGLTKDKGAKMYLLGPLYFKNETHRQYMAKMELKVWNQLKQHSENAVYEQFSSPKGAKPLDGKQVLHILQQSAISTAASGFGFDTSLIAKQDLAENAKDVAKAVAIGLVAYSITPKEMQERISFSVSQRVARIGDNQEVQVLANYRAKDSTIGARWIFDNRKNLRMLFGISATSTEISNMLQGHFRKHGGIDFSVAFKY